MALRLIVTVPQLDTVTALLHRINERTKHMATQADVDAIVSRIDTATTGIRQDIADIKAAFPQVDLTALEDKVSSLEGLDAENPVTPPTE